MDLNTLTTQMAENSELTVQQCRQALNALALAARMQVQGNTLKGILLELPDLDDTETGLRTELNIQVFFSELAG